MSTDMWHSTGAIIGGLLLQLGGLLISVAMLKTRVFSKLTRYLGNRHAWPGLGSYRDRRLRPDCGSNPDDPCGTTVAHLGPSSRSQAV